MTKGAVARAIRFHFERLASTLDKPARPHCRIHVVDVPDVLLALRLCERHVQTQAHELKIVGATACQCNDFELESAASSA